MAKIPVILDGDPGHDDAVAWMLALSSPELDVRAAIAVSGNVSLEKTASNAERVLTLLGRDDVPFAAGAARPLIGERIHAPAIFGESGLDGAELPVSRVKRQVISGVELMAKVVGECDRPVTIIATGPLTDVAMFLTLYGGLKEKISRISLMGGGLLTGNMTPAAEGNICADPEAAKVVFESGVPIVMSPLDVTERALVLASEFERFESLGTPVGRALACWLKYYFKFYSSRGFAGAPMHDSCAVAYLLAPDIFEFEDLFVEVETGGRYTRGATIGDYYKKSKHASNARVLLGVDRERFLNMLLEAAASYGEAKV